LKQINSLSESKVGDIVLIRYGNNTITIEEVVEEVVERTIHSRHVRGKTIFTNNKGIKEWLEGHKDRIGIISLSPGHSEIYLLKRYEINNVILFEELL